MRSLKKATCAATVVVLMFGLSASRMSANRLFVNEDEVDIKWSNYEFHFNDGSSARCPLTLLGRFHSRAIAKTTRLLLGYIDHAQFPGGATTAGQPPCTGGTVTILTATLPWHITYAAFSGSLPRPSRLVLLLVGAAFRIETNVPCLVQTDTGDPGSQVGYVEPNGLVTRVDAEVSRTIDAVNTEFFCELASVRFAGPGVAENRHLSNIRITLV